MSIKNKSFIDSIRRNRPYFEDMITRSVYHSNAIEGNTLSYYETYQIIFNTSSDEVLANVKPRDLYEAINLKYAMDYIFKSIEEDITTSYIVELGKIINKNVNEISSFRTTPVYIRGAEHIPPEAEDVPRLMQELLFTSFQSENFLRDLADFHIRYERIHPFIDGNGRTGRVLLSKKTLQNGLPPIVIPKEERDVYMEMLAECDTDKMESFFERLLREERERMKKFQIAAEDYGKPWNLRKAGR